MRPYCIFPRGILWPLELPPLYFISGSAAALLKTPITVPTTVSSTAPQATSLAHCQQSVSLSSSFCGDAGAPSAPAGGSAKFGAPSPAGVPTAKTNGNVGPNPRKNKND